MAEEKTTDKDDLLEDLDTSFDAQFDTDKALGLGMNAVQPKKIDNKAIDTQISQIEKPSGGSVYDKMAARYRSQGEGAVLRTQKNLGNLFLPTINLIKEREAAAQARFTLLKDKMPEFDDSTIFGNLSGNEMPIKDYVMDISKSVKEDLRMLSRLNPNDERYDEIKKRVDKNQKAIVDFDDINQQLLKIRNTDNDESQWSAGMDQTTADMWRDIYSSKGENIKIVDGKLVWTDTRGETSYEFKGGSFIDDKWEALGKDDTDLGYLASYTRDDAGNQYTFENGDTETSSGESVAEIQKGLIRAGFTDADGNELDPDGKWGPKSQAAYDKYLEQKDGLEKAYLDENYEGDAKKTSGTGGTRTIDLSQIGDGPTMIDNKGTNMDIALRGETQKFIEMGGKVDDPMYNQMIKSKLFELNKIGPQGLKSLIFDGVGLDDKDMFTGSNTDSFIEKVIADTYADGDISKLSEKEIEGYIQEMKSGDVTLDYNDGEGSTSSLQSLFMKWYKGEIDDAITEGKKSKVVASSSSNRNSNSNNRRNRTTTTTTNTNPTETSTNENDNFSAPFIERFGTDTNEMFTELTTENATYIGGGKNDGTTSGNLFNYGDDDFVENTLNRTYGSNADTFGDTTTMTEGEVDDSGPRMSFRFVVNDDDTSFYEGDRVTAWYRDKDGTVTKETYEFDNMYGDKAEAKAMQKWMRGKVEDDMDAAKAEQGADEVYVGEEGGSYEGTTTDNTTANTTTDNTTTTDNATTFRSTMSNKDQGRVNMFAVDGTGRANFAKILKNGEVIQVDIKGKPAKVTGVKAVGNELVVEVKSDIGIGSGDYDLGKFVKDGNGFKFKKNNEYYGYLEGDDKREFDAFIAAIESDPAFANEIMKAVSRTDTMFETKNY